MRWKHDEWAQRWNAERLIVGVEECLRSCDQDPARTADKLSGLLRVATPRAVVVLEGAYRGRRRSLVRMLGTEVGALTEGYGRHAAAVAALLTFDRSGYLREAGVGRESAHRRERRQARQHVRTLMFSCVRY